MPRRFKILIKLVTIEIFASLIASSYYFSLKKHAERFEKKTSFYGFNSKNYSIK
jgi:hypothetical protein